MNDKIEVLINKCKVGSIELGEILKDGTLEKTKTFLKTLLNNFKDKYGKELSLPKIMAGIDGDVDLEWKFPNGFLIISIPEKDNELAGLYGEKEGVGKLKIDFDERIRNDELLEWLKS